MQIIYMNFFFKKNYEQNGSSKKTSQNSKKKTPLYKHVKQQILEMIAKEVWAVDTQLPNEKVMSNMLQVSVGTLRKAVDHLISTGVLMRKQGRGTFINKHSQKSYLFRFFHIVAKDGEKELPFVRLIKASKVRVKREIAEKLGVPAMQSVMCIQNLLYLQHKPVIIDYAYLSPVVFPTITSDKIANRPGTLYQLYQEEFNVSIVRIEERISSCLADADQALLLGVKPHWPLLKIVRNAHSIQQNIAELRYSFCNTDLHEYRTTHFA